MTELNWDTTGEHFFELGVDRGVLYVGSDPGVVWPGLISVDDASSGGATTGYYIDGVKYLNSAAPTEFAATINAYARPKEFDPCEGVISADGMSVTHQPRKPFGFSWRSKVGNDLLAENYGYKIHLVYNARAEVSQRSYATIGSTTEPMALSWPITAKPIIVPSIKPTPYFVFDSSDMSEEDLAALEDILYGTSDTDPRLPTVTELLTIFDFSITPPPEVDLIIDGGGSDGLLDYIDAG